MRKLLSTLVFIINFSCLGQTNISGTLPKKSVWTKAGSPYNIKGNFTLNTNDSLIIEKGTIVIFELYNDFDNKGILVANGTSQEPINFQVKDKSTGWQYSSINASPTSKFILNNTQFEEFKDSPAFITLSGYEFFPNDKMNKDLAAVLKGIFPTLNKTNINVYLWQFPNFIGSQTIPKLGNGTPLFGPAWILGWGVEDKSTVTIEVGANFIGGLRVKNGGKLIMEGSRKDSIRYSAVDASTLTVEKGGKVSLKYCILDKPKDPYDQRYLPIYNNGQLEATYCAFKNTRIGGDAESTIITSCDFASNSYISPADNANQRFTVNYCNFEPKYDQYRDDGFYFIQSYSPKNFVDGRYNYWGHDKGPTHAKNPNGKGAKCGDNVIYTPYISQRIVHADKAIYSISPEKGGNLGTVTINVFGNGFIPKQTKLKLTKTGESDLVVADSLLSASKNQIQATINLKNKTIGKYNLVIQLPDTTMILKDGFEVEKGLYPNVHISIIAPQRIRRDTWTTVNVIIENKSNVDTYGVPFGILIPLDTSRVRTNHKMLVLDTKIGDVPFKFPVDSIDNKVFNGTYLDIIANKIKANSSITFTFHIKTNALKGGRIGVDENNISIKSYVRAGFYLGTPLGIGSIYSAFSSEVSFKCKKELALFRANLLIEALLARYAKLIPIQEVDQCAKDIAGKMVEITLNNLVNQSIDGLSSVITGIDNEPDKFGDAVGYASNATSIFEILNECIKDVKLVGSATKWLGRLLNFADLVNDFKKVAVACGDDNENKDEPVRYEFTSQIVSSYDPNDKLGNTGVGGSKNVRLSKTDNLIYQIRFENKATATAPAQMVYVLDTLDAKKFDFSTFQFMGLNFGNTIINLPNGSKTISIDKDLRPAQNLIVRINGTFDAKTGVINWRFTSLDPKNYIEPQDADAGFLPPNKVAPNGEGWVMYSVKPKDGLAEGDEIANKAYIYFDTNPVIPTPVWKNKIDNTAPTSAVKTATFKAENKYTIKWDGQDKTGVYDYSIYVSKNGADYTLWQANTTAKEAEFTSEKDAEYRFKSMARDSALNVESKTNYDLLLSTKILAVEPITKDSELLVYPNPNDGNFIVELLSELPNEKLSANLYNVQGQQLFSGLFQLMQGKNKIDIQQVELKTGTYLLCLQTGEKVTTKKILISR